jgi:hypothetical protein
MVVTSVDFEDYSLPVTSNTAVNFVSILTICRPVFLVWGCGERAKTSIMTKSAAAAAEAASFRDLPSRLICAAFSRKFSILLRTHEEAGSGRYQFRIRRYRSRIC